MSTTSSSAAEPVSTAGRGKLGFLDGLRGWAALWVVFNHVQNYLTHSLDSVPIWIREPLILKGGLGVMVFFTISGYVITRSVANRPMSTDAFGNFCKRRLARLTPPYYASLILAVLVNFVSTKFKDESFVAPTFKAVLAHLVYLPDLLNLPMINGVHWTLYIEVQFYLLLAALLWLLSRAVIDRAPAVRTTILTVVGALALIYPVFDLINGREHYFFPYLCAFLSGCFIYWYHHGQLNRFVFWGYFLGMAVAMVHLREIYVACFCSLVLITIAQRVRGAMSNWLSDRISQFLGHISYSLYLTHPSVLGATYYFGTKIFGDSKSVELALIVPEVAACIVVGYLIYLFVERPAIKWSQSMRQAAPTVAPA